VQPQHFFNNWSKKMEEIQKPDAEGWYKWAGGQCPVDPKATVEIRIKAGQTCEIQAGNVSWQHIGKETDVIEYRLK
jgi:hypothetical protein